MAPDGPRRRDAPGDRHPAASVDVITGLIKGQHPLRIAFAVSPPRWTQDHPGQHRGRRLVGKGGHAAVPLGSASLRCREWRFYLRQRRWPPWWAASRKRPAPRVRRRGSWPRSGARHREESTAAGPPPAALSSPRQGRRRERTPRWGGCDPGAGAGSVSTPPAAAEAGLCPGGPPHMDQMEGVSGPSEGAKAPILITRSSGSRCRVGTPAPGTTLPWRRRSPSTPSPNSMKNDPAEAPQGSPLFFGGKRTLRGLVARGKGHYRPRKKPAPAGIIQI